MRTDWDDAAVNRVPFRKVQVNSSPGKQKNSPPIKPVSTVDKTMGFLFNNRAVGIINDWLFVPFYRVFFFASNFLFKSPNK